MIKIAEHLQNVFNEMTVADAVAIYEERGQYTIVEDGSPSFFGFEGVASCSSTF